jgi:hypothetical protein
MPRNQVVRIHQQNSELFPNSARESLVEWVTDRSMHVEEWARYNFKHLTCFDIETTSPAEGAHHGLKSDNEVHSHAELSHLLMADCRRVRQLYFEMERDNAARTLEEATNVQTQVEALLHKHFVLVTCTDVVAEFIQSINYIVSRKREHDDDDVVALVWRRPIAGEETKRPFKFSRIREIRKVQNRLVCCCSATQVHGRPCRHLLAYNKGLIDVDDFHECHLKKYAALSHTFTPKPYVGVHDRREPGELPVLEANVDGDGVFNDDDAGDHNGGNDDGDFCSQASNPGKKKKRKVRRGYNSTNDEFKRILTKWGNTPRVLEKFRHVVAELDASLGAVEDWRSGKKSSKPTPQASRK